MTLTLACLPDRPEVASLLAAAFRRSLTHGAVRVVAKPDGEGLDVARVVAIADAPEAWGDTILRLFDRPGCKLILFGRVPRVVARALGVTVDDLPPLLAADVAAPTAPIYGMGESAAQIVYRRDAGERLGIAGDLPLMQRSCCRHDFTDEWNNLGYGAVLADGSVWSLAQMVVGGGDSALADVTVNGGLRTGYAALWRGTRGGSLLWFNRPVGPIDSQEWRLVERYLSCYGASEGAVCLPVPLEIPAGFDAAVTMRLDCDEDLASAAPLFDLYRAEGVPLSLAVCTKILDDPCHASLLRAVRAAGGSVLTHSATHASDWGGSYEAARREVDVSRARLRDALADQAAVRYAVSPFHQNPTYAVAAMADSGLQGFVGGIIRNDPAYLMARGGAVPGGARGFVSHSQSCMLHGDCLLAEGDPLAVYRESFAMARRGGALFGYLDHPFSPRYAYGWASEDTRVAAHADFLKTIKASGRVAFMAEDEALDWIRTKDALERTEGGGGFRRALDAAPRWRFAVEHGEGVAEGRGAC